MHGERFADLLGNADVRHFPDAGHWPWIDDPSVIDVICAFLDDRTP